MCKTDRERFLASSCTCIEHFNRDNYVIPSVKIRIFLLTEKVLKSVSTVSSACYRTNVPYH